MIMVAKKMIKDEEIERKKELYGDKR